jgi:uncharacterized protein
MVIKVAGLADGIYEYEFDLDRSVLGFDEDFISNIKAKVDLKKANDQVFVECECSIEKRAECDRCLDEFKLLLKSGFFVLYTYDKSLISGEDEGVIFLEEFEDSINLNDLAREALLLSIPMKLLCREECKGLCIKCGKNLNIDSCNCEKRIINPEFEKLKQLNFNKNNNNN